MTTTTTKCHLPIPSANGRRCALDDGHAGPCCAAAPVRMSDEDILEALQAIVDEMNERFREGTFGANDRVLHVYRTMALAQHLMHDRKAASYEVSAALAAGLARFEPR